MRLRQNPTIEVSSVLAEVDWEIILYLWNTTFPQEVQLPGKRTLKSIIESNNTRHYTIRNDASKIEAWLGVFDRYDTRWFSILVSPEAQGRGRGKALIEHAKTIEHILEGWVVQSDAHSRADGECYHSPLVFYKKLGFVLNPNRFPTDGKLDVVCVKWRK